MTTQSIKLNYLPLGTVSITTCKPQPCIVMLEGNKTPTWVVPVNHDELTRIDTCFGCIAYADHSRRNFDPGSGEPRIGCADLPMCGNEIYVRATPANKLRHIAYLLGKN